MVHKRGFDAETAKRYIEKVMRSPVNVRGTDDMISAARQVECGKQDGRLSGRSAERAHAAFERGDFFFHRVHGGIADAGIKEARFLQIEKPGHFGGGIIGKGRALDNGKDARLSVFGGITGVKALGFRFHGCSGILVDGMRVGSDSDRPTITGRQR